MTPEQARILFMGNGESTEQQISAFVRKSGSVIVGTLKSTISAREAFRAHDFPKNVGNPNVVLLSDYLGKDEGNYLDGADLFERGYSRGIFRPASSHGLGVLVIGWTGISVSPVAEVAGAHYLPGNNKKALKRWAELLDDHTESPEVPPSGTISRDRFEGVNLGSVLKSFGHSKVTTAARLLTLKITEQVQAKGEQVQEYTETAIDSPTDYMPIFKKKGSPSSLYSLMETNIAESREATLLGYKVSATAVINESELVVIRHSWKRCTDDRDMWNPPFRMSGSVDHIPLISLQQLPQSYWQEVGLSPGDLVF